MENNYSSPSLFIGIVLILAVALLSFVAVQQYYNLREAAQNDEQPIIELNIGNSSRPSQDYYLEP